MTEQNKIKECESLAKQVKGVVSARVVGGNTGDISEIHVLADSTRSPKQVVRDIESALLAQLGMEVDHKKISVAQLQGEEELLLPGYRPRLEEIELLIKGIESEARATVNFGKDSFTGTASGPNMMKNRLLLIAVAVLSAVENFLGGTIRLMVEDVQKVPFAGKEIILAGVLLLTPAGEETLLGSALVVGDDRESAAKAVLDALNRRLVLLKKE